MIEDCSIVWLVWLVVLECLAGSCVMTALRRSHQKLMSNTPPLASRLAWTDR
jgi:hypothetical protein